MQVVEIQGCDRLTFQVMKVNRVETDLRSVIDDGFPLWIVSTRSMKAGDFRPPDLHRRVAEIRKRPASPASIHPISSTAPMARLRNGALAGEDGPALGFHI